MEKNSGLKDRLPFGNAKRYLGIASVLLSPLLAGFVLGVIAVYLADKDTKILRSNEALYSETALRNHKSGLLWAGAGFMVSMGITLLMIYLLDRFGTLNPLRF